MATADDLSAQLAARQQAYRLLIRDRGDVSLWLQRLMAGITAAVPSPAGSPPTATPPAGGGDASTQRVAALKSLLSMVTSQSGQYANQPQLKSLLDGVTGTLQNRITALESGTAPGGPLAALMTQLAPTPAAQVGAVPQAAMLPGTPTVPVGQGATLHQGDVAAGIATPVASPGLGGATATPTPVPPSNTPTPPSQQGGQQQQSGYPYNQVNAETGYGFDQNGPPAGWSSSGPDENGNEIWYPPDTSAADKAAADAQAAADKAAADKQAAIDKANYDKWLAAANTDYVYANNLYVAAAKMPPGPTRDDYIQRARDYEKRAAEYTGRLPAGSTTTT